MGKPIQRIVFTLIFLQLSNLQKNCIFLVAKAFSVDIIGAMSRERTVCSTFPAIISLSLLLRRLAQ
jgi:hypothetical protein